MHRLLGETATTEDLAFCPALKTLYETGVSTDRFGKVYPQTGGLSTINNLVTIRRLFEASKPARTLELGFGGGGSALAFAACHRALGRAPEAQHVAIDPFQEAHSRGMGFVALERAGLSGYVKVFIEPSQFVLPNLLRERRRFGLIYFDGSKKQDDLFCDFYFAKRLLDVGGCAVFDDCAMPSVRALIKHIDREQASHFERVPRAEYRRVTALGETAFRTAEMLGRLQLIAVRKTADYPELDQPAV